MTIIVFDSASNVVHVDSKCSFDPAGPRRPFTRDKRVNGPNYVATAAGDLTNTDVVAIVSRYLSPDFVHCERWAGTARGTIVARFLPHREEGTNGIRQRALVALEVTDVITPTHPAVDCDTEFVLGCGTDFYFAYRAIGHSVSEAVALVAQHHPGCGAPVTTF